MSKMKLMSQNNLESSKARSKRFAKYKPSCRIISSLFVGLSLMKELVLSVELSLCTIDAGTGRARIPQSCEVCLTSSGALPSTRLMRK